MVSVLMYLSGLLTIPLVMGALALLGHLFSKGHGIECVAGDFDSPIGTRTYLETWFRWKWHRITVGRKGWHREAVRQYQAMWASK